MHSREAQSAGRGRCRFKRARQREPPCLIRGPKVARQELHGGGKRGHAAPRLPEASRRNSVRSAEASIVDHSSPAPALPVRYGGRVAITGELNCSSPRSPPAQERRSPSQTPSAANSQALPTLRRSCATTLPASSSSSSRPLSAAPRVT